jgi:hypothetical protein
MLHQRFGSAMVLSLSECAVGGLLSRLVRGDMHDVMYRMFFGDRRQGSSSICPATLVRRFVSGKKPNVQLCKLAAC